MIHRTIEPEGWPCTLEECPPGYFIVDGQLCLKSQYSHEDSPEKIIEQGGPRPMVFNSAGEFAHWPKTEMVQPVDMKTDESFEGL